MVQKFARRNGRIRRSAVLGNMLKRKARTRVAPFRNRTEFAQVHELLFGAESSPENLMKAFEILMTWKTRRGNELSASILSTLAILEAQLRDISTNGGQDMASIYAGACTRFLNYVSSIEQKAQNRSMFSIARSLGLETFLVELRHICAHGQNIPSLDVFRRSATYCMNWLRQFYWDRELRHIQDTTVQDIKCFNTVRFERNLRRMALIYDAIAQGTYSGCTNVSEVYGLVQDERLGLLREYVSQLNESNVRKIFNCILADFITASKSRVVKEHAHIFCSQLLSSPYFIESSCTGDIRVISLHSRLLAEMQKCGYISEFFYTAIHVSEDGFEVIPKRRCAVFWANRILEVVQMKRKAGSNDEEKRLVERFKAAGFTAEQISALQQTADVDIDLSETFLDCRIKNACYFTYKFINRLFSIVETQSNEEKYAKYKDLFKIFANADGEENTQESKKKVYTVDDVISQMPEETLKQSKENPQIWEYATGSIDWKKVPLGAIIET